LKGHSSSTSISNSEIIKTLPILTNHFHCFQRLRIIRLEVYQTHLRTCSRWVFKSPTCGRPLRSTPSVEKHEVYQCSTPSTCTAECSLSLGSDLCSLSGLGELKLFKYCCCGILTRYKVHLSPSIDSHYQRGSPSHTSSNCELQHCFSFCYILPSLFDRAFVRLVWPSTRLRLLDPPGLPTHRSRSTCQQCYRFIRLSVLHWYSRCHICALPGMVYWVL
jgi:hypothetical protein